jgi:hypothetical protein
VSRLFANGLRSGSLQQRRRDQALDLGSRPRRVEQIALHFGAAFRAQPLELLVGFNAFGGAKRKKPAGNL